MRSYTECRWCCSHDQKYFLATKWNQFFSNNIRSIIIKPCLSSFKPYYSHKLKTWLKSLILLEMRADVVFDLFSSPSSFLAMAAKLGSFSAREQMARPIGRHAWIYRLSPWGQITLQDWNLIFYVLMKWMNVKNDMFYGCKV